MRRAAVFLENILKIANAMPAVVTKLITVLACQGRKIDISASAHTVINSV